MPRAACLTVAGGKGQADELVRLYANFAQARAPTARLLTRMPGDKKSALTTIL